MATLNILNLPDEVYRRIEEIALSNGRTVDEEAKSVLEAAAREAEQIGCPAFSRVNRTPDAATASRFGVGTFDP